MCIIDPHKKLNVLVTRNGNPCHCRAEGVVGQRKIPVGIRTPVVQPAAERCVEIAWFMIRKYFDLTNTSKVEIAEYYLARNFVYN
jgi:hypothetical protein